MHNPDSFDRELTAQLRAMPVPEASAGLEKRILMAAFAESAKAASPVAVHSGEEFTSWWNRLKPAYGGLALAASVALMAVFFLHPAQQAKHDAPAAIATAAADNDRYTVDGVPLLADVDMSDDDSADTAFAYF